MPADGAIHIAFDRYLDPSTPTRQALSLFEANGDPVSLDLAPLVSYDPIAMTITLASPRTREEGWLVEGQLYTLLLRNADEDRDGFGIRAIDGAALVAGQKRRFEFVVGPATGTGSVEPSVDFCAAILPTFYAKCGSSSCHGPGEGSTPSAPAAGLLLTTPSGIGSTAIGRVAQGSNTGASAGTARSGTGVFGIDMPIVDPENPGGSWLLYKLELTPPPRVDAGARPRYACGEVAHPSQTAPWTAFSPYFTQEADAYERSVLGDYVLGREMPFPSTQTGRYETQPLTFAERELVRLWIAQGAPLRECGSCRNLDADAGLPP